MFIFVCFASKAFSNSIWINDLTTLFSSGGAIIYGINLRTFGAVDTNKDGIIEEDQGEERGTFLNAIGKLDELVAYGVNTVHLMPVTPVGKTKALGTAGSLYAISDFKSLNPQLKSPNSKSTINDEMKMFVDECHKRKLRVIVDLPSCGSYDLYLKNPELFIKDKNQNPVVPADWTDVRLFNAGTEAQINMDVYNLYSDFIDFMMNFDVDGVRADVAMIKPASFWKKLIAEKKARNPEFLFLAEASPLDKSPSEHAVFTSYNKLLDAGFEGYYGSYSDIKNWKTSKDLISHVKSDIGIAKKYSDSKRVIGNFATHDQVSPILVEGPQLSKMIIWLNSTLPLNPYYVDGFPSGDTYIYPLMNKKASKTYTDDEYYFVHRGQLDLFNFSRKPWGSHYDVLGDFILATKFRKIANDIITKGNFVSLRTSSSSVFAYGRCLDSNSIIVIGNLDFKKTQNVVVYVPKLTNKLPSVPIKLLSIPQIFKGKIVTSLEPGEVIVVLFNEFELK